MGSAFIEKQPVGELTENPALAVRLAKKVFYVEEAIRALMKVKEGFGNRKHHYCRLVAIMAAGSLTAANLRLTSADLEDLRELANNESNC